MAIGATSEDFAPGGHLASIGLTAKGAADLNLALSTISKGSVTLVHANPRVKAAIDSSKQAELNKEADSIFSGPLKDIKVVIAPNDPNAGVLTQSFSTNGKFKGVTQTGAVSNPSNANLTSPTTVSNEVNQAVKGGAQRSDDRTHAVRVMAKKSVSHVGGVHVNAHGHTPSKDIKAGHITASKGPAR